MYETVDNSSNGTNLNCIPAIVEPEQTSSNSAFSFWDDPSEDIYTMNDGEPV